MDDNDGGGRSEGGGDMRAFVLRAWESPGAWHRAPGRRWALRFPPRNRLFGEAEFEIRGAGSDAAPHRYRRTRRGAAPERVREDARDYDGPSAAGFPEDEASFARAVAGVLDEWPDSRGAGGELAAVAAELVRRYLSALESDELSRRHRFWIAFAGSSTISLALTAAVSRRYIEVSLPFAMGGVSEFYPGGVSFLFLIVLPILFGFALLFALLFAFLCSWKSRVNGPLRIYAISFIFSYTVWSVASSVDVGVGAGSSP